MARVCAPSHFLASPWLLAAPEGSCGPSGAEDWSCWTHRAGGAAPAGRHWQLLQGARELLPIALPLRVNRAGARVPAGDVVLPCRAEAAVAFPCALRSSGLCVCAIPHSLGHRRLRASPSLARAGTVSLGQATALASDCEVSAHLGHLSAVSLIKAAGANYCHMLGMI